MIQIQKLGIKLIGGMIFRLFKCAELKKYEVYIDIKARLDLTIPF